MLCTKIDYSKDKEWTWIIGIVFPLLFRIHASIWEGKYIHYFNDFLVNSSCFRREEEYPGSFVIKEVNTNLILIGWKFSLAEFLKCRIFAQIYQQLKAYKVSFIWKISKSIYPLTLLLYHSKRKNKWLMIWIHIFHWHCIRDLKHDTLIIFFK